MPVEPPDPDDLLASLPDPGSGLYRTASGRMVQKRSNLPLVIGLGVGAVVLMGVALTVALGDKKAPPPTANEAVTPTPTPTQITPPPKGGGGPPPPRRDDPSEKLRAFTEKAWGLAQRGDFQGAIKHITSAPSSLKASQAWTDVAERDLARYRALSPLQAKFERALQAAKAKTSTAELEEVLAELDEEHGEKAFAKVWRTKAKTELGEDAYDAIVTKLDAPPDVALDPEDDPAPTTPDLVPLELTRRGNAERRKRFAAEAVSAKARLAKAKAALAARRAREAKRWAREAKRVKKATRSRKRGRWAKTRVTDYSADGFTLKRKSKQTVYRWETCPADLGYEVMKLAVDLTDEARLLDLCLYAYRRGAFEQAELSYEQLARRSSALAAKLPSIARARQAAKVFRGRNNHKPSRAAGESTTVKWTFERSRPQELRDFTPFDRRIRVGAGPSEQLLVRLSSARAPMIGAQVRGNWEDRATLSLTCVSVDPPPCLFVATTEGRFTLRFGAELEMRKFLSKRSPLAKVPLASPVAAGSTIKVALAPKDARTMTITVSIDKAQVFKGDLPGAGRIAFAVGAWTNGKPGQILFDDVRIEGVLARTWSGRVVARAAYDRVQRARSLLLRWRDPKQTSVLPRVFAPTSAEDKVALEGLPTSIGPLLVEGRAALAKGKTRAAASAFRRAAATPECAAGAYLSGRLLLLAAGRPEAALLLFERATAGVEDFFEALVAKASVLARLGRASEARAALDQALALRPDYAPAYLAEADLHLLAGDVDQARAAVELAEALAPNDSMVALRRDQVRAVAAGPSWTASETIQTEHYEVISDIPEPAQIGRQLEAIATRYAEVVPASVRAEHERRKGRLAVRVFRDPARYYHYAYATRGRRASGATGQFNPQTGQLLIHLTDADRRKLGGSQVLFHEAFHQWCFAEGLLLPHWLTEGLAEYVSGTTVTPDGRRVAKKGLVEGSPRELLGRLANEWEDRVQSWQTLMTQPPHEFFRRDVSVKRAQAWSIAHFVDQGPDAEVKTAFLKYLTAYQKLPADPKRQGARLTQAYLETLHPLKQMPKLLKAWEAYVAKLAKANQLPAPGSR